MSLDVVAGKVLFDAPRDVRWSHRDARFDAVLHVFDHDWHGIRSAAGCLPGHKLAITHERALEGGELRYIFGHVHDRAIRHVVFQGYSESAGALAHLLRREFGAGLDLRVVTHVTASQFEHLFELRMLRLIQEQLVAGVLDGAGSVKPDFDAVFPPSWPGTLLNLWPNVAEPPAPLEDVGARGAEVFVPVENTFRKNLYVNLIAAHDSDAVARVLTVNEPSLLDELRPLAKHMRLPYQDRDGMIEIARRVDAVMNVTFAECQPMTQLEALAVGTPCLVGPLGLPGLQDLALSALCTVDAPDNPRRVRTALERVLGLRRDDPAALEDMIAEYRAALATRSAESYLAFLGARR